MTYTPTTWTDEVTDADAANLNKLEGGVKTATEEAETAAAKANTAKSEATTAKSEAATAKTEAATAKTTANTAKTEASTANAEVGSAKTEATAAKTKAEEAKLKAEEAKTKAEEAKTLATAAAPKASPKLTGTPEAPKAAKGNNSEQIANTAWVMEAIKEAVEGVKEVVKEEGSKSPGVVQANFAAMVSEQEWAYNELPLRSDMFRWNAISATLHPQSANLVKGLEQVSKTKMVGAQTIKQNLDYNNPWVLGKASDPEETITETPTAYSTDTKMHVPTNSKTQAKTTASDEALAVVDVATERLVELSPYGNALHDFNEGPGYSANSKENTTNIPFKAGSKAIVSGSTTWEVGGGSSARIATAALMIRFPNLYQASVKWQNAIPHPLGVLVQGAETNGSHPESGMAPRGTTKYGEGIVASPADTRGPYVFPAHQGEAAGNSASAGTYKEWAPPMGMWFRLNMTEAAIEALAVPSWIKAIYWAFAQYGGFFIDVQGAEGMSIRLESAVTYSWRSNTYATSWLETNTDSKFITKTEAGYWAINYVATTAAKTAFFSNLQVLLPPPKPSDLTS